MPATTDANTDYPQTQGGRMLKRGYTFDPECHRTTYRLGLATRLLAADGIVPVFRDHADDCMMSAAQRFNRCAGWTYHCTCGASEAAPEWPSHVTGATFDAAYRLADEMQSARGNDAQRQRDAAGPVTPADKRSRGGDMTRTPNILITGDAALVGDGKPMPVLGAAVALAQTLVARKGAPADATLYVRENGSIRYRVTPRGTWPVADDPDNGKPPVADEVVL